MLYHDFETLRGSKNELLTASIFDEREVVLPTTIFIDNMTTTSQRFAEAVVAMLVLISRIKDARTSINKLSDKDEKVLHKNGISKLGNNKTRIDLTRLI
jgi:hypothetical protein